MARRMATAGPRAACLGLLAAVAVALGRARPCFAAAPTLADTARAKALLDDGLALVAQGRAAEGCPKIETSAALDPTGPALLGAGGCLERRGATASAWAAFGRAEGAARGVGDAKTAEEAAAGARRMEALLCKIEIDVAEPRPPGLTLALDGEPLPLAELGTAFPVDPGPHTVTVHAPGRVEWTQTIALPAAAGTHVVSVPAMAKEPALVVAPGQVNPYRVPSSGEMAAVITLVSVTFVGCVSAAAIPGLDLSSRAETDTEIVALSACGAGLLTIAGVYIAGEVESKHAAQPQHVTSPVRVGPMVAFGAGGLSVSGAW
jgi:hypothetical protein